ncbi:MAG: protein-glutamate O-methyltransferase CheR [Myxococcota bacterium]|nr:protein-glutamate O-methyltransferase CheR [Myxococcota bacterium]
MDDADVRKVREILFRRAGIELGEERRYLVVERLGAMARELAYESAADLVRRAPAEQLDQAVLEALTTHETSFFREPQVFEALRMHVLPELIASARQHRRLWLWSAAASTGQEAYSLAMQLHASFPEVHDWDVRIFATDLSARVVGRIERGLYTEWETRRGLPPHLHSRYLVRRGGEWEVVPELRRWVRASQLNLIDAWPTSLRDLDLVLVRNVLIYLHDGARWAILRRVRDVLKPRGRLVLGSSESRIRGSELFEAQRLGGALFHRPPGFGDELEETKPYRRLPAALRAPRDVRRTKSGTGVTDTAELEDIARALRASAAALKKVR